jgi:hypothetical protein
MAFTSVYRTPISRRIQDLSGNALGSATVNIYNIPGSAITTIYSAETGSGTTAQPLTSAIDGSISGWLEIGVYQIEATYSGGSASARYYVNHPQQSLLQGTVNADSVFELKDDGDSIARFSVNAGGTAKWSSGSGSTDANLYRSGVGTLATDNTFVATAGLKLGSDDIAFVIKMNKEVFG